MKLTKAQKRMLMEFRTEKAIGCWMEGHPHEYSLAGRVAAKGLIERSYPSANGFFEMKLTPIGEEILSKLK